MNIIYLDDYHLINANILPQDPIVVKVGIVGWADMIKLKDLYPMARIIGYEPDPDNFANDIKAENPANKVYCKAVGIDGHFDLCRFTNSVSNSSFERHKYDPNCVLKDMITVDSVSLETVIKENDLSRIDILILNCEGGELDIMPQLANDLLREKIGQICVSFHDPRIYLTQKRREILDMIGEFYHIVRGTNDIGGIPDYLLIRKV